jgi:tetraacyldisaccharide 4'-kinase
LNQETYRKLISGQSKSLDATLLRFFLQAVAKPYAVFIALRNLAYSKGWLKVRTADVPVISVGNITVGGTGKTPLVVWICNTIHKSKIKNQKCKVAILTRGYKATQNLKLKTQNYVDELAIFAGSCPQAKVIVNPDRVAAAHQAVNKFGADVLIMDDGFQHRRLSRNLDIVTIDATSPFGYSKMLPAGLLREPIAVLKRANAVVITRCNQVGENELAELEKKLRLLNPNMTIARSIHEPVYAKAADDKKINLDELKGKKVFAFCGIANPDSFLKMIKKFSSNLVGSKIYNDHYHYTDSDLYDICKQARHFKADLILTTQKDWSRLPIENQKSKIDISFAYLAVELKFISGEDKITPLIENALGGKIAGKIMIKDSPSTRCTRNS